MKYPDIEHSRGWRVLAYILAAPIYLREIAVSWWRHRRAVRKWRRLDPVQAAQVVVHVIASDAEIRRMLREALASDLHRLVKGRNR